MSSASNDPLHRAVNAIIDADMSLEETVAAFWSLIPKEFHVTHLERCKEDRSSRPAAIS